LATSFGDAGTIARGSLTDDAAIVSAPGKEDEDGDDGDS
jgi:hypothetical protein